MKKTIKDFAKELDIYFERNNRYYCIYDCDGKLYIEIEWGDWKHDHLYADEIVRLKAEANGLALIMGNTVLTEENGSDCYSATHKYIFAR